MSLFYLSGGINVGLYKPSSQPVQPRYLACTGQRPELYKLQIIFLVTLPNMSLSFD